MKTYVLDWETFYSSKEGYTLKKMTTEEYINDPRFHAFGFSILRDGGNPIWVPEEKIEYMLRQLKLEEAAVIAHNAPFDMAILNWKYGVKPKFVIDTLAMARIVFGTEERLSLEALSERLGIGEKGDAILHMDGVRVPSTIMAKKLAEYAKTDARLAWGIWKALKGHLPKSELLIIDMTTRMFSEPSFALDKTKIGRELELADNRKEDLLLKANCSLEDLRSDAKFAEVLISLGVEPPRKLSLKRSAKAGHDVYTWAFAKSDADFKALAGHENELVRWAVEARLGLKSTIKESRAQRFMSIAERMGVMPVALDYAGANTHRYTASTSAKVNMQNLPAARGVDHPDVALLRKSLIAPDGKIIVVADLSQIEARLLVWQAGQDNVLSAFAEGRDVYSEMASVIFSRHIDRKKNPEDFIPGFIGKAVVLGCGYGLGHMKFGRMIYAGMLGMKGIFFDEAMAAQLNVDPREYVYYLTNNPEMKQVAKESKPAAVSMSRWVIHLACSQRIINMFRANNKKIPEYWRLGERLLAAMYEGSGETIGMFPTRQDALMLPNGMWMHFKELELNEDKEFSCLRKKEGRVQRVKMYGGKVVENVNQALAGVVTKEGMVRMYLRGYRPILQVHDEVVAITEETQKDEALASILECMTTVPSWAAGLPLAAEGGFAHSYGEAK